MPATTLGQSQLVLRYRFACHRAVVLSRFTGVTISFPWTHRRMVQQHGPTAQKVLEDQLTPSAQRLDEQALLHHKNPLPIDESGRGLLPSLA